MNTGTRIRTVLAIVTTINTVLMATDVTGFNNPKVDLAYKIISVVFRYVVQQRLYRDSGGEHRADAAGEKAGAAGGVLRGRGG